MRDKVSEMADTFYNGNRNEVVEACRGDGALACALTLWFIDEMNRPELARDLKRMLSNE